MSAFLIQNMAPLMFASLIVVMLIGYPVAFALAATGIVFGLVGVELGLLSPALFQALPQRMWAVMSNDTLLAVPFFTFMGLILERSGMAEDLLDTVGQLFGPLRGGLAFAVIFVGALLAATTGVVAASVISMGLISLPIMLRYGYDRRFASGVIAASGTLAQIIPPSLVLIIMADQLGRSVGDMYAGAIFPGWAPPTEGGPMGASGALAMAIERRRLSFKLTRQAMETTAKLSTFVVFILVGARVFSLTFYGVKGHVWVEELLTGLPGGQLGFLIVVNIVVFVLAFFLDFFELSFIVVPLLGPVAEKLGIDLIWFGVLLGVNMQTSFMHPPFGFALFYLRSVAPAHDYIDKLTGKLTAPVTTTQIYWGAIPFVVIQLIMVALLIFFPQMSLVYKSGEPEVDPSKVKLEIPGDQPADAPDDIMKDLQKGAAGARPKKEETPAADAAKAKTEDEKAAEEIERALKGGK